jgi:hypothetical protein
MGASGFVARIEEDERAESNPASLLRTTYQ